MISVFSFFIYWILCHRVISKYGSFAMSINLFLFEFSVQKKTCRDVLENGISQKGDKSPNSKVVGLEELIFNKIVFV